jgi:hypothetical protein
MTRRRHLLRASVKVLRHAVLLLLAFLLAASTATTFASAAGSREGERQHHLLAHALLERGITRIYTDYWTCDRIAFQSRERIVCAVVGEDLRRGYDRYRPYRPLVESDPGAAWVLPLGSPQAAALARALATPCPERPTLVADLHGYLVVRPAVHLCGPHEAEGRPPPH